MPRAGSALLRCSPVGPWPRMRLSAAASCASVFRMSRPVTTARKTAPTATSISPPPHYSTLLKFDTTNYPDVIGDLAESWAVSADQLSYSFNLRPGVLFHDGSALTAQDVKASYQRSLHPPPGVISVRQLDLAPIEAIETPDELTVVFHLGWGRTGHAGALRLPVELHLQQCQAGRRPAVSTHQHPRHGSIRVCRARPAAESGAAADGSGISNPASPPWTASRRCRWVGRRWSRRWRPARLPAEFHGFDPAEVHELRQALGDRMSLSEAPWLTNILIVFNTKAPPFDDERVRRALSLAIDRWGLSQSLSPHHRDAVCRRFDAARQPHGHVGAGTREPAGLLA